MKVSNTKEHSGIDPEERIAILEQKLKEKTSEVELLKDRFLSNISHEIRTPMNAIVGFSSLLKDQDLSQSEKNIFLEGILKSSDNLMKIIDNLIQTARIESNNIKVFNQEVEINKLFKEIQQKFVFEKESMGKRHIDIRLPNNTNKKKLIIKTDTVKLKHILCNLLENALKFTEKGFIELGYKLKGSNKIEFYVKDSGIGIPQQKLSMVFDKFTQVEDSSRKKHNGLGIGLCISKSLTEVLGGQMNVSSSEGNGSVFSFTLPLQLTDKPDHQHDLYKQNFTWPGHHHHNTGESVNYWKKTSQFIQKI